MSDGLTLTDIETAKHDEKWTDLDTGNSDKQEEESVSYAKQLEWKDKPYRIRKKVGTFRGRAMSEVKLPNNLYGMHSIRIAPDGSTVALGFGSGEIQVRDMPLGDNCIVMKSSQRHSTPVTTIRYHPKNSKIFYAGTCSGRIIMCNLNSIISKEFAREPNNEINCTDINRIGETLASGGKDTAIRLYDIETEKNVNTYAKELFGRNYAPKYHTLRVYSIKFHNLNPSLFFTGGWNDCIKCWDIRLADGWIRNINGPRVCGDSIDVKDNVLLTGSWVAKNSLQLWDYRTGKLINTVSPLNRPTTIDGEFVYQTQFYEEGRTERGEEHIVVGESGSRILEVIEIKGRRVVGKFPSNKSIRSFHSRKSHIVYGGSDDTLRVAAFV